MLLEKGAAYQSDIGWLTSKIAPYYNFSGFGVTYNFITYPNIIDENCYNYKFYDTVDKKIKDCKIYSLFSHFKGNGFEFQRIIGPKKNDTVSVSLFDNNKKIKTTFIHNFNDINYYTNLIYRDRNVLIMQDFHNGKWYHTNANVFHEALSYATKTKKPFNVSIFWGDFYEVQKKGTGYVMATLEEWRKLVLKELGHLIPFIVRRTKTGRIDVGITRNKIFLTAPTALRVTHPLTGILKNCRYLGDFVLDEEDTKKLPEIYPGFCFTRLSKCVRLPQIHNLDFFGSEDMKFMKKTEYNNMPLTNEPFIIFLFQITRIQNGLKATIMYFIVHH